VRRQPCLERVGLVVDRRPKTLLGGYIL